MEKVKLTAEEQDLFDNINWDLDDLGKQDYEVRMSHFEKLGQLSESLIGRKVIPQHRWDWFTNPEFRISKSTKSRSKSFVENSGSVKEMFRHPHFMKVLNYFIFGPDLPEKTINGFVEIVESDRGTTGMLMDEICSYVRKEIRDEQLFDHDPATEFFKLALETGYHYPETIHKAAKSVRRR